VLAAAGDVVGVFVDGPMAVKEFLKYNQTAGWVRPHFGLFLLVKSLSRLGWTRFGSPGIFG
jgi:hypothetical protein